MRRGAPATAPAASSPSLPPDGITLARLRAGVADWLLHSANKGLAAGTLDQRRIYTAALLWWLDHVEAGREAPGECPGYPDLVVGRRTLERFFHYVRYGPENGGPRWGNERSPHRGEAKAGTVATYHRNLRCFFRFLQAEEYVSDAAMERVPRPRVLQDQIQPFSSDQFAALVQAAKRSVYPRRNVAILYLLLDTGMRASELCALRARDLDLDSSTSSAFVRSGKGDKARRVFFGGATKSALLKYLQVEGRDAEQPVFLSERGVETGAPLTASGLGQMIHDLGAAAGLSSVRCSPHTLRHTFALRFLEAGGNVFALKELLGHTTLHMVNRYLALSQARVEQQYRPCSPVDNLRKQQQQQNKRA